MTTQQTNVLVFTPEQEQIALRNIKYNKITGMQAIYIAFILNEAVSDPTLKAHILKTLGTNSMSAILDLFQIDKTKE